MVKNKLNHTKTQNESVRESQSWGKDKKELENQKYLNFCWKINLKEFTIVKEFYEATN